MKIEFLKIWYAVALLLVLNIAVGSVWVKNTSAEYVGLHFFDVGQGDSIYLRTPQGNDILIDGGPGDKVLSKLGRIMPFNDRKIEFMILTHPHADHVSGLVEILKRYEVDQVFVSSVDFESSIYQTFRDLLEEKGISVLVPRLGQRIYFDETTVADVLFPVSGYYDGQPKDPNDISTVLRISYGKNHVLLTADADKDIENFLLNAGLSINAEILKVGHQGSKTSSGERFVNKVKPDWGIISVGKNSYGHPHDEVLSILQNSGSKIIRTDESGDIVFKIFSDRIELQKQ